MGGALKYLNDLCSLARSLSLSLSLSLSPSLSLSISISIYLSPPPPPAPHTQTPSTHRTRTRQRKLQSLRVAVQERDARRGIGREKRHRRSATPRANVSDLETVDGRRDGQDHLLRCVGSGRGLRGRRAEQKTEKEVGAQEASILPASCSRLGPRHHTEQGLCTAPHPFQSQHTKRHASDRPLALA